MSKRGAEIQLTKDGVSFNDDGSGQNGMDEDTPRKATAAQMANRRIKSVKRRPGASQSPTLTPTFGASTAQSQPQAPIFGGLGASQQNGNMFGASQNSSFPPANGPPATGNLTPNASFGGFGNSGGTTSGGGPFNFSASVPNQSFTFSAQGNNPFANTSGGSNPASATNGTTSAPFTFGVNSTSQTAPQQPSNIFGSTTTPQTPGSSIFNLPPTTNPISSPAFNLFGQNNKPAAPTQASATFTQSPFQQPSQPDKTIFGSADDSMQTSPDNSPQKLDTPKPSTFSFLNKANTEAPIAKPPSLFAKPSTSDQTPQPSISNAQQPPATNNLFGSSATMSSMSGPTATPTTSASSAGPTSSAPEQAQSKNPFATVARIPSITTPAQTSTSQSSSRPSNLFADAFSSPAKTGAQPATGSIFSSTPSQLATKPPAFQLPSNSTSANVPSTSTPANPFSSIKTSTTSAAPAVQPPSSGTGINKVTSTSSTGSDASATVRSQTANLGSPSRLGEEQKRIQQQGYELRSLNVGLLDHLNRQDMNSDWTKIMQYYLEQAQKIRGVSSNAPQTSTGRLNGSQINGQNNANGLGTTQTSSSSGFSTAQTNAPFGSTAGLGTKRKAHEEPADQRLNGDTTAKKSKADDQASQPTTSFGRPYNTDGKRKADEESAPQSDINTAKKAKSAEEVAYPTLPTSNQARPASQTATRFADILANKSDTNKADNQQSPSNNIFAPSTQSSNPVSTQTATPTNIFGFKPTTTFTPSAQSQNTASVGTPFSFKPPSATSSNTNAPTSSTVTPQFTFKPTASATGTSSTPTSSSPFTIKPLGNAQSSAAPADGFKVPTFGTGASNNLLGQFAKAAQKQRQEADYDSDEETLEDWQKRDAEEQKQKNEKLSSSAPKANFVAGQGFVFGGAPALNSTPASVPTSASAPAPAIQVPTFGTGASGNLLGQFAKAAQKQRQDADYDSEEETLEEWKERDAKEQEERNKKAAESAPKTSFVAGQGFSFGGAPTSTASDANKLTTSSDALRPTSSQSSSSALAPTSNGLFISRNPSPTPSTTGGASVFDSPHLNASNNFSGGNIFGHLSDVESGAEGSRRGDADDEDTSSDEDEEETADQAKGAGSPLKRLPAQAKQSQPSDSDEGESLEEVLGKSKQTKNSSATGGSALAPPGTTMTPGRSLFDRITPRDSPAPEETTTGTPSKPVTGSNLFGQNTPSLGSNLLSKTSPAGDHTWKASSPIKFGATPGPPPFTFTPASPSKTDSSTGEATNPAPAGPFAGLFGTKPAASFPPSQSTTTPAGSPAGKGLDLGFTFGPKPSGPLSLFPPASGSSQLTSNVTSGITSRATTPGLSTDAGESAAESAADGDEDAQKDPQNDLTSLSEAEKKEEDVIFETAKVKARKFVPEGKTWQVMGLGPIRILKNRDTGVTRILMKVAPRGTVLINSRLLSHSNYKLANQNKKMAQITLPDEAGKLSTWLIQFGSENDASDFVQACEANKTK